MSNSNTDILLAGAIAAFTVDLLVYPLDTLKTRLQSPDYKKLYTTSNGAINKPALFRGVYQGLGSVILATLPSSGAFFTTYEGVKSFLSKHNPSIPASGLSSSSPLLPQAVIHSLSSAVAESVSCFILTPAEVLKQNAQMVSPSSSSAPFTISSRIRSNATLQALRQFKHPSQLWSGYGALLARNLPFTAMQFPMFEHLRARIKSYRSEHRLATGTLLEAGVITAVSAGSAGSIAAVLTTPVDVIKTRIMLSAAAAASSASKGPSVSSDSHHPNHYHHQQKQEVHRHPATANPVLLHQQEKEALQKKHQHRQYKPGAIAIGKEILRTEGMRGLWRGGALRGVWTALGSGLYLGAYESGRVWLGARSSLEGEKIV